MKKFFEPKAVAVIGASREEGKPGRTILEAMQERFKGAIYPVNSKVDPKDPSTQEISGLKAYPSIIDIPGPVDLAVIAIPAAFVSGALEQCKKKKVEAIVIISGGFREVGRKDLEDQLLETIKKTGMRIIGPNCIGVADYYTGVNTSFIAGIKMSTPQVGGISLVSQSGAVASTTVDWAAEQGIGMAKMISYGNAADLDIADFLSYLGDDPKTKVILVYNEGITDGKRFMEVARQTALKKPIVAFKAGKGEAGAKAVASHTGSLAGAIQVYSAALKQSGIMMVDSLEELLDFGKALNTQPVPKGKRVLIVTCGGGFGVMATDAIEAEGLEMAQLSDASVKAIRAKVPDYVVIHNPVDIIGDADSDRYQIAMDVACKDPNVDAILLILLFQIPRLDDTVVERMISMQKYGKPIVCVSAGSGYSKQRMAQLERAGMPVYPTPERGVKAIKALVEYKEVLERLKR